MPSSKSSYGKSAVIIQVEPSVASSTSRSSYSSEWSWASESAPSTSSASSSYSESTYRVHGAAKHQVKAIHRGSVSVYQGGQKSYVKDAPTPDPRANSNAYNNRAH